MFSRRACSSLVRSYSALRSVSVHSVAARRLLASQDVAVFPSFPQRNIFSFSDPKVTANGGKNEGEKQVESEDSATATDEEEGDEMTRDELNDLIKKQAADINEQEEKIEELNVNVLRALADNENTRKRCDKNVERARKQSIKSFAKSLLDVVDNLTRAQEAVNKDVLKKSSEDGNAVDKALVGLCEGVDLTQKVLLNSFSKHGVKIIESQGKVFDPNLHEVVFQIPDKDHAHNTILEVPREGYVLFDEILRSAQVGTANNPEEVIEENKE